MAEQPQNAVGAGELKIPEGDRYLFVRLGVKGDLQVLFSNEVDAIALHKIFGEWMDLNFIHPAVRPKTPPQITVPGGLDLGSVQRRMNKLQGKS